MNNNEMTRHLPQVDLQKLAKVLAIKEEYNLGKLSLDEARAKLKATVGSLKPYEIALAEQELKAIEEDECRKEDIQAMMALFEGVMDASRPTLADDHPIMLYYRENDEMRRHLLAVEDLVQYPIIKNQWFELYDLIGQYRIHLARKQNQLYSVLERKGFDRPTTTMWLLDDFIRDEIRDARTLIEQDRDDEFIAAQASLVADIRDLMDKEEAVLYPTALAMITDEEFEEMKSGDREIGFAWITLEEKGKQTKQEPAPQQSSAMPTDLANDLANLLGKYGYQAMGNAGLLDVATGKLSLEQINLIYKHLPIDISFVDENELVCFYSDTDHRIFPRSKNVIGRDVKNCHPRTSVHLVEEIIEKFRSGEQDTVDFWINKPGLFIYIYYVAVRDSEGQFRGVLEMMQDCTRIRALEGSRTLLKWSQDTQGATKADSAEQRQESQSGESKDERQENEPTATSSNLLELTPQTKLKDLLSAYPTLKDELPKINSAFKMLKSPLARIIIPKADIATMSERSGMPLDELINQLNELLRRL